MSASEGMIKLFSPDGWGRLPAVEDHQIKVASGGLGYGDRKTAEKFASPELLHWISRLETHPDCVYVHKVAMGASDYFGPNRWGDGFRAAVLERDCPTFEQFAKAYRMHKAGRGAPFFGRPKLARLRKDMGVVELVTEYYGSDKVAADNGGKLADKELEQLAKQGSIAVSMGSKVPGDVCVQCGHWATKRAFYCTPKSQGGQCTLFGCKGDGMLKVAADGRQNYVDNPTNLFYDISWVDLGADPIAHGIPLPLGKLAGFNMPLDEFLSPADFLPGEIKAAEAQLTDHKRTLLHLASLWAELEGKYANYEPDADIDLGLVWGCDYGDSARGLHFAAASQRARTTRELAQADICPDFAAFAKAAGYSAAKIAAMRPLVADAFSRLAQQRLLLPVVNMADFSENRSSNLASSKRASIHDCCHKSAVISRALDGHAHGQQLERVTRLAGSQTIPDVVAKYAAFKLAWAAQHPNMDLWRLHSLVKRELVTVAGPADHT